MERTFGSFCLPNADSSYDASCTESDNHARDNELRELERGRHEYAANRLHKTGYPYRLTTAKPITHATSDEQRD